MSALRSVSRADKGSSSSSRLAFVSKLRASATRCRSPAGQRGDAAGKQGGEVERGDDFVQGRAAGMCPSRRVQQVAAHGKMAEQACVLEYATDGAPVRREVDVAGAVEPGLSSQRDASARVFEPGDQPQQRGLAAAAWTEHGRNAVQRQVEGRLKVECAQSRLDVQF